MASNNNFDLGKFNSAFEKQIMETKLLNKEKDKKRLDMLNKESQEKISLYDMSIVDFLIGIKDTWFDILDNLLQLNLSWDVITKDNRLFFIGLTFLIIALFLYLHNNFFVIETETETETKK
jgi:hypothetical protein